MFLPQGFPYPAYFVRGCLSGKFQVMYLHHIERNCRTVFPYYIQGVEIGSQSKSALLSQICGESLHFVPRTDSSVNTDLFDIRIRKFLSKPLCDGRGGFHTQSHQFVFRIRQLSLRRYKISGVRPQCCRCERDHSRTRRTVKPGNPLTPFPMIRHIFTVVRIRTREHKRRKTLSAHHISQRLQSLFYNTTHTRIQNIRLNRHKEKRTFVQLQR